MYLFEIVDGLHEGAQASFDDLPITIGGSLDHSIVIREFGDQSIAVSQEKYGTLAVESETLDITIEGLSGPPERQKNSIFLPATLVANGISIRISSDKPRSRAGVQTFQLLDAIRLNLPDRVKNQLVAFVEFAANAVHERPKLAVALFISIVALILLPHSLGDLSRPNSLDAQASLAPRTVLAFEDPDTEPCPGCVYSAKLFLERLLRESKITGLIVESTEDLLKVRGEIAHEQKSLWEAIQHEYDMTWNARVPKEVTVREIESDAPFQVRSIWLGNPRELTTEEGAIYRVGDETKNGWRIDEIETDYIKLSRRSAELILNF